MHPLSTFTLTDHLDHTWRDELVTFPVPDLPTNLSLAVADEQGVLLPCQLVQEDGVSRLAFRVDQLPPLGTRTFTLVEGEAPGNPPVTRLSADTVELGNGLITVRLPAGQSLTTSVPAPVLGVRRGEGSWIGSGRMRLSTHLQPVALETHETQAGPLWRTWELTYRFAGGEYYTVAVKVFADQPFVEITEESALGRTACWEFSVREGLGPDATWTHPFRGERRLRELDFAAAEEKSNLGAIQMPNYSGIWLPDDYYYFAFLQGTGPMRDCVAAVGVTGGFWDYPYENQIDLEATPDGDAFFRLSLKAGHRRWLLAVGDRAEVTEVEPYSESLLNRLAKRYETPLEKVKEYVLAWDDLPAAQRPFALADEEQLAHAREIARSYAKLAAYRASLDPNLPGDYTYYHSGTHRTFAPDYRNDPAALYVTAETDDERRKQAAFLKDVVLDGLKHRLAAMLDNVGHLDGDSASINLGRGLRPWAALYDFAAAEGIFSEEEARLARAIFAFFCYKINDPDFWPADHLVLRDDHPRSAHRTHWFPRRQHDWSFYNIDNIPHNFHGDLWSAMGCMAMTFPTHPESRAWVDRTLEFWEAELTYWVFPDGPWLESSTYTLNSMKDYLVYCRMLSNAHIRDYFTDERLQRAFRCIAEQLGPYDERIGGVTLPVIGDGGYPNSFCYVLGWMGGLCKDNDPAFAALMNQVWKSTGEYLVEPGRFGMNFCDFLFLDPHGPTANLPVLDTKWYHGLGGLLRYAQQTPEEIYLFIKAGIIYSHFHEPEGTFQLWWDSKPLCDEYGVQYGTGDDGRSVQDPSCHNCIEILGGEPLAYNKGDFTTFITTPAFDYCVVEAPEQVGYISEGEGLWGFKGEVGPAGWHKRHFFFVKPYYLFIYDDLECPYATRYHLNVKADGMRQNGNLVHYDGRMGVDLELLALDLGDRPITHGEFNVEPYAQLGSQLPPKFYHQRQLTIPGAPGQHFSTLLLPHAPAVPVTLADDAVPGGAYLTRGDLQERTFLFPTVRSVADGALTYHGQAGAVREQGGVLTLLQVRGTRLGLTDRLVIDGAGPYTATLRPDGTLTLETDGVARWFTLTTPAGPQEIATAAGRQQVVVTPKGITG